MGAGNYSTTNDQLDGLLQQCQLSKVVMENVSAASTALTIAAFVTRQAALSGVRYQLLAISWLSATSLVFTYSDSTLP